MRSLLFFFLAETKLLLMVFEIKKQSEEEEEEGGGPAANEVHSPSSRGRSCLHNPLPGGSALRGPEIKKKKKTHNNVAGSKV